MLEDSDNSRRSTAVFGIECESLEGTTWGTGRLIRKLLEQLAALPEAHNCRFVLYSNNPLPADPLYDHPRFIRRPTGLRALLGSRVPSSFSAYYFLLLPVRLWLDRAVLGLRAVYHPNYMLPIGAPHRALVMLTDDIFREARNPALPLRYRIAYRIYATGWARRYATRIMAISHASASSLAVKGISRSRIAVNELGVDAVMPSAGERTADFLFVGQAFPRRSLRESLTAFSRIAATHGTATFHVVATDKYPTATIAPLSVRINARLGRRAVRCEVGYVSADALAAAYRSARTVVYVSETEGFGLPPLEGLAYGALPVVADTPVNREIYGAHASFVSVPVTEQGIELAMRVALTDTHLRERVAASTPAIIARYRWEAHALRWLTIMQSL